MKLHELRPAKGAKRKARRVGRGSGSGSGTTSGRGSKGQGARSGGGMPPWFEGGQMPLIRRVPKVGFHNPFRVEYQVVNLKDLARFEAGTEITPELLREAKLTRKKAMPVKLLGVGEVDRPFTIKVDAASKTAREKIEAAGGSLEILSKSEKKKG